MQSVPNYAWEPHKTNRLTSDRLVSLSFGADTLEEAEALVPDYVHGKIDQSVWSQINDVMYLSIYSGLRHTMDIDTQGLASDRIPSNNTADKTLRFLISYIHEKHLAIPNLIEKIKSEVVLQRGKYRITNHNTVVNANRLWTARADKIVDIMETARSKVGGLAAKAEFIRNWALVDLGQKIGMEVTAARNNINIEFTDPRDSNTKTTSQLLANKTMKVAKLENVKLPPAGQRNNETDTLTITSKNGANLYNIKDSNGNWGLDNQLAEEASKTFTFAEATYGIRSRPILPPWIFRELSDQTLDVAVVQSVDLDVTFGGVLLTVAASSDDEGICTVVVTEHGSGLAITGVAAGTTTITVTATNPSGSISTTFDVNVSEVPPSGD